ncbi:MAG: hypothetical protein ABI905_07385 [Betaproteobacteria bacterium]
MQRFSAFALTGLLLIAPAVLAQQFSPPEQLAHAGKIYKLAYKQVAPNGRAIYEYTTNGEPVENWTTMITLNYGKGMNVSAERWTNVMKASLEQKSPKAPFRVHAAGTSGYARFVLEPDRTNPTYESNVHKSFHMDKCGGLLVYQFAVKSPAGADTSAAGKAATLEAVNKENEKLAAEMEKSSWTPDCK